MEIAGISLEVYILVLIVSFLIGFITNSMKFLGNKVINLLLLTLFFLLRELLQTLTIASSPWLAWLFHPITTVVVVGYGLGTFVVAIMQAFLG